jgi:hypothetical protein
LRDFGNVSNAEIIESIPVAPTVSKALEKLAKAAFKGFRFSGLQLTHFRQSRLGARFSPGRRNRPRRRRRDALRPGLARYRALAEVNSALAITASAQTRSLIMAARPRAKTRYFEFFGANIVIAR